ncbi:MAG: response regulator [Deltaproteobacteria bacterium]|nr:response regulator [Deltaproteobacteria bacterium]
MIRVLICDDSFLARKAIKRIIEQDPTIQVVAEAKNGKEALTLAQEHQPEVMTCDMEMPVMDGIQTLMEIRKVLPRIKVIVLSSITQPQSEKEKLCRSLGAYAVIAKPVEHSDLDPVTNDHGLIMTIHHGARP